MNKIWLIIKREYLSRVRKKSFIVTTILAPLSIVALMAMQILIMTQVGGGQKTILLKDDSGYFVEQKGNGYRVKMKDSDSGSIVFKGTGMDLESLKASYAEKNYDGILYIPPIPNLQNLPSPVYYSDKLLGLAAQVGVQKQLADVLKDAKILEAGLDKKTLDKLRTSISIQEQKIGDADTESSGGAASSVIAAGISFVMGFVMYLSIIIYGTMVMRGVMEEKTNRIVEVILSSIKPFKLMIGKIVGIGAVGLTQFMIWIITVGLLGLCMNLFLAATMDPESLQQVMNNTSNSPMGPGAGVDPEQIQTVIAENIGKLQSINWPFLIGAFVFYYLGGYLFYSALFAAIGSAIGDDSSSSESQALVMPVTVPIIISFFILMAIMENPNGSLAFWSSIIPFSSSIIMPARIAFGLSPFSIDFILSVLFLISGFIFTTWLAGKIYRTGILMTGKKVTVKEMFKWVKM